MNVEGVFSKLVELIKESADDGVGLHRRLLELLYEMSRIQRLSWDDLSGFIEVYFGKESPTLTAAQILWTTGSSCIFSALSSACPAMLMILIITRLYASWYADVE